MLLKPYSCTVGTFNVSIGTIFQTWSFPLIQIFWSKGTDASIKASFYQTHVHSVTFKKKKREHIIGKWIIQWVLEKVGGKEHCTKQTLRYFSIFFFAFYILPVRKIQKVFQLTRDCLSLESSQDAVQAVLVDALVNLRCSPFYIFLVKVLFLFFSFPLQTMIDYLMLNQKRWSKYSVSLQVFFAQEIYKRGTVRYDYCISVCYYWCIAMDEPCGKNLFLLSFSRYWSYFLFGIHTYVRYGGTVPGTRNRHGRV